MTDLHDTARTRTVELDASAASDQPGSLMAGGSYRVSQTASTPDVDHSTQQTGGSSGTIRSADVDLSILRQHGAAGLVWQPLPRLRLSGRLDARLTDLDGHARQARNLGTVEIVRADANRDSWSLDGRLRPARATCEQCHWAEKFVGDRLQVRTTYAPDQESSALQTVLLVHVGGVREHGAGGIHWHVAPASACATGPIASAR